MRKLMTALGLATLTALAAADIGLCTYAAVRWWGVDWPTVLRAAF
jgi:hypothetical protein